MLQPVDAPNPASDAEAVEVAPKEVVVVVAEGQWQLEVELPPRTGAVERAVFTQALHDLMRMLKNQVNFLSERTNLMPEETAFFSHEADDWAKGLYGIVMPQTEAFLQTGVTLHQRASIAETIKHLLETNGTLRLDFGSIPMKDASLSFAEACVCSHLAQLRRLLNGFVTADESSNSGQLLNNIDIQLQIADWAEQPLLAAENTLTQPPAAQQQAHRWQTSVTHLSTDQLKPNEHIKSTNQLHVSTQSEWLEARNATPEAEALASEIAKKLTLLWEQTDEAYALELQKMGLTSWEEVETNSALPSPPTARDSTLDSRFHYRSIVQNCIASQPFVMQGFQAAPEITAHCGYLTPLWKKQLLERVQRKTGATDEAAKKIAISIMAREIAFQQLKQIYEPATVAYSWQPPDVDSETAHGSYNRHHLRPLGGLSAQNEPLDQADYALIKKIAPNVSSKDAALILAMAKEMAEKGAPKEVSSKQMAMLIEHAARQVAPQLMIAKKDRLKPEKTLNVAAAKLTIGEQTVVVPLVIQA